MEMIYFTMIVSYKLEQTQESWLIKNNLCLIIHFVL